MSEVAAPEAPAGVRGLPTRAAESARPRWMGRLVRNHNVLVGGAILLVFLLAAVFAKSLATHNPTRLDPTSRLKPPSAVNSLGTDEFGRDVDSLVLFGSRVSLLVGGVTMLLTCLGGVAIGLVAGHYRRLDLVVMRATTGSWPVPPSSWPSPSWRLADRESGTSSSHSRSSTRRGRRS